MVRKQILGTRRLEFTDKPELRDQARILLRQKLLKGGAGQLQDHELADLTLAMNDSQIDRTFDSVEVTQTFKDFFGLLSADHTRLRDFGIEQNTLDVFELVHEASRRLSIRDTGVRVQLSTTDMVIRFLDIGIAEITTSHIVVLFLDGEELLIDQALYSSRRSVTDITSSIARRIIETASTSIVVVSMRKNHSLAPNSKDLDLFEKVCVMSAVLGFKFSAQILCGITNSHTVLSRATNQDGPPKAVVSARATGLRRASKNRGSCELNECTDSGSLTTSHSSVNFPSLQARGNRAKMTLGSQRLRTASDIKLLDALLTLSSNKSTVVAGRLLRSYISFANIITADISELVNVLGMTPEVAVAIKVVHNAAVRILRSANVDQISLTTLADLTRYLTASTSRTYIGYLRILYLDSYGRLQADEVQHRNKSDSATSYLREVLRRAISLESRTLILIQSHIDSEICPTNEHVYVSKWIKSAAVLLGIKIGDHIIIRSKELLSLSEEGLLGYCTYNLKIHEAI